MKESIKQIIEKNLGHLYSLEGEDGMSEKTAIRYREFSNLTEAQKRDKVFEGEI